MAHLRENGEPYYLQIAEQLRGIVDELPAGERLPSEPTLARDFGVSRFTVVKAVEQLVKDGLIVRKQGSGTFVADAPLRRQPGYLLSFTEAVRAAGHETTQKVLAFRPVDWRPGLPYPKDEPLVFLDRLRFVDGVAVARHCSVLSATLLASVGLDEATAGGSDFSLYRHFELHGLKVATADERLIGRLADVEERRLLGLADNAVVISVSRNTFAQDGTPLDAVDAIYEASHYSYEARLIRQPGTEKSNTTEDKSDAFKSPDLDGHRGPRLGPFGNDRQRGRKARGPDRRPGRTG
jgi:GntR family transcriptional regulator